MSAPLPTAGLAAWADSGSFRMVEEGDGTLGVAKVAGVDALLFGTDFSDHGGSTPVARAGRWLHALHLADTRKLTLIGVFHGGGARLQQGGAAVAAYSDVLAHLARTPQPFFAVMTGPCAGGDALCCGLADVTLALCGAMVRVSTAPAPLGDLFSEDLSACRKALHRIVGFLSPGVNEVPFALAGKNPQGELRRIGGRAVVVLCIDGSMTAGGLSQAARLVRLCNKTRWPIILDVAGDGFASGEDGAAMVRHTAQLMQTLATVHCRKIALIRRAAYGAVYALATHAFFDTVLVLPDARMAAVAPQKAVRLVHPVDEATFLAAYCDNLLSPDYAIKYGLADAVVTAEELPGALCAALECQP